jgi:hypothetical protein
MHRVPHQDYNLICAICEKEFVSKRPHALTCSGACRKVKCLRVKENASKMELPASIRNNETGNPVPVKHTIPNISINKAEVQFLYDFQATATDAMIFIRICGFEFPLRGYIPSSDSEKIRNFEWHLRKKGGYFQNPEYLTGKLSALEIILSNKDIISRSVRSPQGGVIWYTSIVNIKEKSILDFRFSGRSNMTA